MGDFWQWMKEKGYHIIGRKEAGIYFDKLAFEDECTIWFDGCACTDIGRKLPKQMLIGYMIEYLKENGEVPMFALFKDNIYNYLVKRIENLNK